MTVRMQPANMLITGRAHVRDRERKLVTRTCEHCTAERDGKRNWSQRAKCYNGSKCELPRPSAHHNCADRACMVH